MLTSIGYGFVCPSTFEGRLFGVLYCLIGLSVVCWPFALIVLLIVRDSVDFGHCGKVRLSFSVFSQLICLFFFVQALPNSFLNLFSSSILKFGRFVAVFEISVGLRRVSLRPGPAKCSATAKTKRHISVLLIRRC